MRNNPVYQLDIRDDEYAILTGIKTGTAFCLDSYFCGEC